MTNSAAAHPAAQNGYALWAVFGRRIDSATLPESDTEVLVGKVDAAVDALAARDGVIRGFYDVSSIGG